MKRRTSFLGIAGLLMLGCGMETGTDLQELGTEHLEVRDLQTGEFVAGSKAKLKRKDDSIATKVKTHGLPANADMFVVWAVFNDSTTCENGNPVTGSPCGPADLGIDATGATVIFYDFQNTGDDGTLELAASLAAGDTSGCLDGLPCRDGLTNTLSSEVHVVMIEAATGAFLQGAQFIP